MAGRTIRGSIDHGPTADVHVTAWAASRFSGPPQTAADLPIGAPDAGPFATGEGGAWHLAVPADVDYYVYIPGRDRPWLSAPLLPDPAPQLDVDAGGGSVKLVDLGVVNAVDLLSGPKTLYTPAANTMCILMVGPDGFVGYGANNAQTYAGPNPGTGPRMFVLQTTFGTSADQLTWWAGGSSGNALELSDGTPIKAYLLTDFNALLVASAPPAWVLNHVYAANFLISSSGRLWSNSGGTSGGTIPAFGGVGQGGTIADGTGFWQDEGIVPTLGSAHLYALIATPVAP
jgi:hypothetical protein